MDFAAGNPPPGLRGWKIGIATLVGPDATTTDIMETTVSPLGVKRGLGLVRCFAARQL